MKKMPDNAKFPVPSGPTAAWTPEDWYDWWKMTGGGLILTLIMRTLIPCLP